MKKIFFYTVFTICTLTNSFSQDMITKKSSEDIKAKVIEVTINEIKYKKYDNLNGPLFTILKSDVLMIRYENGSKDIFNELQNVSSIDMSIKGKQDAITNYKGKSSGAGWTAAATILTSPVLGLIPAITCSSTEPSDENLNYKDPELMKNNDYNTAYTKQAHKTKKKKIWTSFGVGSGAWLLLILLL